MIDYCRRCQQHIAYCGCTEIERMPDRIEELETENARLWDALEAYASKLEEHEIECPVLSGNTKKENLKNDD